MTVTDLDIYLRLVEREARNVALLEPELSLHATVTIANTQAVRAWLNPALSLLALLTEEELEEYDRWRVESRDG